MLTCERELIAIKASYAFCKHDIEVALYFSETIKQQRRDSQKLSPLENAAFPFLTEMPRVVSTTF